MYYLGHTAESTGYIEDTDPDASERTGDGVRDVTPHDSHYDAAGGVSGCDVGFPCQLYYITHQRVNSH
jgi:hypothetical protein